MELCLCPLYCRRGLVSGAGKIAGAGSVPSPGTIIFFDWDHDGARDHVESCDGITVHTIEGNSGDAVRRITIASIPN